MPCGKHEVQVIALRFLPLRQWGSLSIVVWAIKRPGQNVLKQVYLLEETPRINAGPGGGNGSGTRRENERARKKAQGHHGQSGTQYDPPSGSLCSRGWRSQHPEACCPGADFGHPHRGPHLLPQLLARPPREAEREGVL